MESLQCCQLTLDYKCITEQTTVFRVITGQIKGDNGSVSLMGLDLDRDLNRIRSRLGVCPQFDILCDELSVSTTFVVCLRLDKICDKFLVSQAWDHLFVFSSIKRGWFGERAEISRLLSDVRLDHVIGFFAAIANHNN